jgi:sugar lactone lactonase YvrE
MLDWLESGPRDVPVEPLEAAVEYARAHPRRWLSWAGLRRFAMTRMTLTEVQPEPPKRRWAPALAAVAAVAVVAVVAVVGIGLLGGSGDGQSGAGVVPSASATATPTPVPSASPTPGPEPTPMVGNPSCTVATLAGKAGEVGAVDGAGAAARFNLPNGLAFDKSGLLYVVDGGNHAIRTITSDGVVTTYAGKPGEAGSANGDRAAARFDEPTGIAFDAAGAMYVADNGNGTIRKISPDGTVSTLAGKAGEVGHTDGVGDAARFTSPWSIAVDAAGTVFVGELDGYTIRKITPDGTVTTLAGTPGVYAYGVDGIGSAAGFGWPFGLAVDLQGVLYVADVRMDRSASVLRTVTPDGTVATLEADWSAGYPGMLWLGTTGVAYVSAYLANTILEMTPDGTVTLLAGIRGVEGTADGTGDVAGFTGPMGIVRDASGVLYVADAWNATIRTVTCP